MIFFIFEHSLYRLDHDGLQTAVIHDNKAGCNDVGSICTYDDCPSFHWNVVYLNGQVIMC